MSNPSPKQLALQALAQLPDDATLEDAMERLYLLESIERGRADLRAGRGTLTHQEQKYVFPAQRNWARHCERSEATH